METNNDIAVYILARTDLPSLNAGKLAAQVHHAGVQMMAKLSKSSMVKNYILSGVAEGADNFNTTIVLGAELDDIIQCSRIAKFLGDSIVQFDIVTDPSYPFFVENIEIANLITQPSTKLIKTINDGRVLMVRKEITCAWFIGDRNNTDFKNLFSGLSLHP